MRALASLSRGIAPRVVGLRSELTHLNPSPHSPRLPASTVYWWGGVNPEGGESVSAARHPPAVSQGERGGKQAFSPKPFFGTEQSREARIARPCAITLGTCAGELCNLGLTGEGRPPDGVAQPLCHTIRRSFAVKPGTSRRTLDGLSR